MAGLLLAAVAAGCAAPDTSPSAPYACLLPSEQRMLVAELFFGRNVSGRGPVTDAEWSDFAAQVVTANFPDGFTAFDASGQWRSPTTGQIARDPTKVLLIAAARKPDLPTRLTAVMDAYKTRFNQQSVGIITRDSCAAF